MSNGSPRPSVVINWNTSLEYSPSAAASSSSSYPFSLSLSRSLCSSTFSSVFSTFSTVFFRTSCLPPLHSLTYFVIFLPQHVLKNAMSNCDGALYCSKPPALPGEQRAEAGIQAGVGRVGEGGGGAGRTADKQIRRQKDNDQDTEAVTKTKHEEKNERGPVGLHSNESV